MIEYSPKSVRDAGGQIITFGTVNQGAIKDVGRNLGFSPARRTTSQADPKPSQILGAGQGASSGPEVRESTPADGDAASTGRKAATASSSTTR